MHCASCGFANPEGVKFCIGCGVPLQHRCPSCGVENLPQARFCGDCGTSLTAKGKRQKAKKPSRVQSLESRVKKSSEFGVWSSESRPIAYTPRHLAERILAEQAAMEARGATDGERKTITALFADMTGSTALIEDLDPEDARRIIDPALQLMMDAVHRYEGYVAQSLGDGIFALFGAPIAHEDHPQRALYAALRMQEEMQRYADRLRLEQRRAVADSGGDQHRRGGGALDPQRRSAHRLRAGRALDQSAARMESLAMPGSIVVSEHTYKLTEGYFEFKALGAAAGERRRVSPSTSMKCWGWDRYAPSCRWRPDGGWCGLSGGRVRWSSCRRALELAKAGHGQIVGVMGEPGVGKSRLFYEFKLLRSSGCLVLETFSVSHGKAYPYLPLIELLKNYFQLTLQDDERQRREKITGKVLTLDRSLEDTLPYLFFLLGIAEPTPSSAADGPADPHAGAPSRRSSGCWCARVSTSR